MSALEQLPARVEALESQIVQLRSGMRGSFLRSEIKGVRDELRSEMAQLGSDLRSEMAQLANDLRGEMKATGDRLEAAIQESRDHSRVLFDEVIASPGSGKDRVVVRAGSTDR